MFVWIVGLLLCLRLLLRFRRRWSGQAKSVINAGLSLWILAVLLSGCELYFAFVFDETDSFNMTNISRKWFRKYVEPDQHIVKFATGESSVYRDDIEFQRPTDSQRHVMFIGDSFTFGHGIKHVDDRFSNRVRRQLANEHDDSVIVSNFADAGRDLHWVEAMLQRTFASNIRTDTVVYVMCLNDIETFHPRHQTYYTELGQHSPCIDLLDTLRPHFKEGLTVSRFDAHPNVRAHELAAETIYDRLSQILSRDESQEAHPNSATSDVPDECLVRLQIPRRLARPHARWRAH